MTVTFDQPLIDYMQRKGYTSVVVDVVESKTCCAGYSEIVTSFANERAAADLQAKKKVRRVLKCDEVADDGTPLQILVVTRGLDYDDDVECTLTSFLGLKDVKVKGIRAFSI